MAEENAEKAAERESLSLLEIEERFERRVTAPLKSIFAAIIKELEVLWPGDDASPLEKRAAIESLNLDRFGDHVEILVDQLIEGATTAIGEGVERGLKEAELAGRTLKDSFKRVPPSSLVRAAKAAGQAVNDKVDMAKTALGAAQTKAEVQTAVTVAASSTTNVAAAARHMINAGANEGLKAVAKRSEALRLVWRPERDACVKCLNRAGQISTGNDGKPQPPEHPNCRCTQYVLDESVAGGVAQSLVREAQRSILRGFSLPSESNKVRIEAARKLLAKGTNLPKSVKEYARTAVRRGEFPKGRDFPGVR